MRQYQTLDGFAFSILRGLIMLLFMDRAGVHFIFVNLVFFNSGRLCLMDAF